MLCISELTAGSPRVEAPVDVGPGTIDAASPGAGFDPQGVEVGDSATAKALACEQPDFDFRLVEPTAVTASGGKPCDTTTSDGRIGFFIDEAHHMMPAGEPAVFPLAASYDGVMVTVEPAAIYQDIFRSIDVIVATENRRITDFCHAVGQSVPQSGTM